MPELPEVETVRRGLAKVMAGRTITRLLQRRTALRRPLPENLAEQVEGQRIDRLTRRAKYLLIHLDNGLVLMVHLGMSGRFFIRDNSHQPDKHDHVVLTLDNGAEIIFNDARRFGQLDLVSEGDLAAHPSLKPLGPEPLEKTFTGAMLAQALAGRRTPVKVALMDQRLIAGIGNIYACEALYRARIDPKRLAGSLNTGECRSLAQAIKAVLNDAIAAGGSSLRNYVNAEGELGYFQHGFDVYGRAGQPCKRDKPKLIQRIVQGGRSTFYCPLCQK